jgi:hypothetical protein
MKRSFAGLLAALAIAMPQARAEVRGFVHVVINPEAPRTEWLRRPLPGAYIAVFWTITIPGPGHAGSACPYSELARSDEKGEYVMEGPNFITAALARTSFLVYSPGLEPINFPYGGSLQSEKDITMARSTLARHERLSRIAGYTDPHCSDTKVNDPRVLLDAYHRSLLDEAKTLEVESPRGRIDLQSIEAAVRRTSGLDKPGPMRAVIVPASGAIQSRPLLPGQRP